MQAKSSINFKPIKSNAENHNKRLGNQSNLSYVRSELSHLNEIWEGRKVREIVKELASIVKEKTGRKMQAKAVPVREAVVNIKSDTTLDDLKKLANELEEKFGIKVFQIATHKDEGHHKRTHIKSRLKDGSLNPEWKPNLHAHIVCEWIDRRTGKRLDLDENDMSEIQTLTANVLKMQRGEHGSKRQRLEAKEFKLQAQEQQAIELLRETEQYQRERDSMKNQKDELDRYLQANTKKLQSFFDCEKVLDEADIPKSITDASDRTFWFNIFHRIQLFVGNYLAVPDFTFSNGFKQTMYAIWDKGKKKLWQSNTKPTVSDLHKIQNKVEGMKEVKKQMQINKKKGVKL